MTQQRLYIDIETFSTQDLRKSNVYRYSEDPEFEIMMAAYAVDDGPVLVALGTEEIDAIPGLWDPRVEKIAHNAPFERVCFSRFSDMMAETQGYDSDPDVFLDPAPWTDTMMWAAELGLPQSLGALAVALGAEEKDEAGTRLINLFCKPYRGRRVTAEEKPEDWKAFVAYCIQDVATLRDVHQRLLTLGKPTDRELEVFLADQRINDHGIAVDVATVKRAILAAEHNAEEHMAEAKRITGLENPNSTTQLMDWFRAQNFHMDNLQAATVQQALTRSMAPPSVTRVLELRQEMALTAAKKFGAIMEHVCRDNRLRGQFRFFGAHTGRWSGKGVQLHNLPRHQADDPEVVILDLALGLGATSADLKGIVRAVLMGPFGVVDLNAIEARVLALLAGEEWVLQAFRDGKDLYVVQADKMTAILNRAVPFERKDGKIAVLALGYNGSIGSLRAMGAEGSDEDLYDLVSGYRESVPSIVRFWKKLEQAFRRVAGRQVSEVKVGRIVVEAVGKRDVRMVLPSGRALVYHDVRAGERLRFKDARGWTDTYGGRLTENATQAVARDVLAEILARLLDAGYNVAGHVHDEVLVDLTGRSQDPEQDLATITEIMTQVPDWATDLPLAAEGFVTERYRKG